MTYLSRRRARRRIYRTALGTAALAVAGTTLAVAPAHAATSGDTPVTFSISTGTIAISAPSGSQDLGSAGTAPGSTTSAAFSGPVSVTDNRGSLVAAWTVTVSSTNFTGTGGTPPTFSKANVNYSTGTVTSSAGLVVTPSINPTFALNSTLVGAGTGSNSASWTPTVGVTVPVGAVADTYSGTITHSVA